MLLWCRRLKQSSWAIQRFAGEMLEGEWVGMLRFRNLPSRQ